MFDYKASAFAASFSSDWSSNDVAIAAAEKAFWSDPDPMSPFGAWDSSPDAGSAASYDDVTTIDALALARPSSPGGGGGNGGGGKGGGGSDGGGTGDPGVLSEYVSGDANVDDGAEYNVSISFKGSGWTSDLQQEMVDAADLVSTIVLGDIPDVFFRGNVIDDIAITASLKDIDGVGGVLGQAGPTAVRTDGYLPAAATMEFDTADAATYDQAGLWKAIVVHEMLHCIGFGSIWGLLGLVDGAGTANPTFTGADATQAYADLFGGAGGVPVEGDGGSGTADAHWDEQTFDNELMTGYINDSNYLSGMTVASLQDLGYNTTGWANWSDLLIA